MTAPVSIPVRRCAVVLAALTCLGALGACAPSPDPDIGRARRVFVVAMPGLSWRDVSATTMPNLMDMAANGAVANVATRTGRSFADPAGAYLTMNAGTRAVAGVPETGVALGPGEIVGGRDTAELVSRRAGLVGPDGVVYLAAGPTSDANEATAYGADVGMLGDRLAEAGVERAVVANADVIDELQGFGSATTTIERHREAAALLMGSDGVVPRGDVSQTLLVRDPTRPFGIRYDADAVTAAVYSILADAGDGQLVIAVEASDLARDARYRSQTSSTEAAQMRRQALADADELLGRIVALADPDDAVLVLGVPTAPGRPTLGVAVLRTATTSASYLRSPTTGRNGYVQLADVAPSVLHLVDIDPPGSLEGRAFMVADRPADALARLAGDIDEAAFRDRVLPTVTVGFIAANAVLALLWLLRAASGRWLRLLGHTILGSAAATFLVGTSWLSTTDSLVYCGLVVGIGLLVGAISAAAEARWPGGGTLFALSTLVGVVAVDVVAGAPLQVNTSFGYSVAVAGRFAGLGNLAFSLFGAAALLLAVLVAERWGRLGLPVGIAVLAGALIIDGFPLLGADVGGTLTLAAAFALAAGALFGVQLRPVHLAPAAAAGLVITIAFAAVDLARPDHLQTHLARFARLLLDREWGVLADSLGRRLQASFGGVETAGWVGVAALGAATVLYVHLVDRGRLPRRFLRRGWPPSTVAAAVGLAVLGVVGWVANDSSIAVPATMMIVVVPVFVDHQLRQQEPAA